MSTSIIIEHLFDQCQTEFGQSPRDVQRLNKLRWVNHPRLRHSVRAIVLDEEDRVLLCRFAFPDRAVWATPGGGIEPGESPHAALRRELREETGLAVDTPPHVWHQEVVEPGHARGFDGVINDYFLVPTRFFAPDGTMSKAELADENIAEFRWWSLPEIADYRGPELFSPRGLGELLATLIRDGVADQAWTMMQA